MAIRIGIALSAALAFSGATAYGSVLQSVQEVEAQSVAVPTYFYPGSYWPQTENGAPMVSLTVINPSSGPGSAFSSAYAAQVASTQGKGLLVLAYVASNYANSGGRAPISTAKAHVDRYYQWYPSIDGIFIDEVTTNPADAASGAYYDQLYRHIKSKTGRKIVVINPGTQDNDDAFMRVCDITCNFESRYSNYMGFTPPSWVYKYPASRFWHLVFQAPGATEMKNAVARSKRLNAGLIYVTPDGGDGNPWDSLPSASYWREELEAVQPLNRWSAHDGPSSVTLRVGHAGAWSWKQAFIDVDRSASTGYPIQGAGAELLIENGSLYRYSGSGGSWAWTFVRAVPMTVGTQGEGGWIRWEVEKSDLASPAGDIDVVFAMGRSGARKVGLRYRHAFTTNNPGSILQRSSAENDSTRVFYRADINASYSWKHVFIDEDSHSGTGYAVGSIGADFMIENGRLYRHAGSGWSWQDVGSASLAVSGPTHTWTIGALDLGTYAYYARASRLIFHMGGGLTGDALSTVYVHRYSP